MTKLNKLKAKVIPIAVLILLFILAGGLLWTSLNHNKNIETHSQVSVHTEFFSGKGVVYAWGEGAGFIVTAGHIMDGLSSQTPCTVVFANGEERIAELFYRSDTADVAFLKVEGDEVPVVKTNKNSFDTLAEGDALYCLDSDYDMGVEGTLISPWIYLEDFGLNMMLTKLECGMGMSGCGIYDENGYFVGILCGVSHEGEAAILPLSVIESQWIMAN